MLGLRQTHHRSPQLQLCRALRARIASARDGKLVQVAREANLVSLSHVCTASSLLTANELGGSAKIRKLRMISASQCISRATKARG